MKSALLVLGLTAVLLSGCGGNGSAATPEPSGSPTTTTGTSAGTTADMWTLDEAAAKYLAMTKQGNKDLDRLKALTDSSSLDDVTGICRGLAGDTAAMSHTARSDRWPDDVKPLMKRWGDAVSAMRAHFAQCARAKSFVDANAAIGQIANDNSADETVLVKAALGIGPTA
jgi:hypothetical protein